MIIDLYKILDLDYKVSNRKLFKRFVELSKKYHPEFDKSNVAQNKFVDVNIAYYILEYNDFREKYDILYRKEILKSISSLSNQNELQKEFDRWLIDGKEKSAEYSNLTYKKFYKEIPKKESVFEAIISAIIEITVHI